MIAYFLNEFDGVVAFPNVRGEGGHPEWHDLGRNMNKTNTFEDVKAAASYLVHLGLTKHEMITIHGVSHGGLVVTTCINQAPKLFGCAISEVGVMDVTRFHLNGIGHAMVFRILSKSIF